MELASIFSCIISSAIYCLYIRKRISERSLIFLPIGFVSICGVAFFVSVSPLFWPLVCALLIQHSKLRISKASHAEDLKDLNALQQKLLTLSGDLPKAIPLKKDWDDKYSKAS